MEGFKLLRENISKYNDEELVEKLSMAGCPDSFGLDSVDCENSEMIGCRVCWERALNKEY